MNLKSINILKLNKMAKISKIKIKLLQKMIMIITKKIKTKVNLEKRFPKNKKRSN